MMERIQWKGRCAAFFAGRHIGFFAILLMVVGIFFVSGLPIAIFILVLWLNNEYDEKHNAFVRVLDAVLCLFA